MILLHMIIMERLLRDHVSSKDIADLHADCGYWQSTFSIQVQTQPMHVVFDFNTDL